ncbi:uncharacterized protein si:ch211-237l4.6 [Conger conger]|uniref:uncharacterized protein si:ch211-237l4.6 n=1 Tax=Conger conger TaxID=82655 RepID=UPI002A5A8698|nr:uncharacterized protein si:ch211-237l4.6 [Conger conger]XP_061103281.1 uncharacterized protein si:ch211-237l4.6 [Conger conger]XP_061103282.1 uncharacterized protein si:ch211-237l4.6 [Conger conger]
MGVKVLHCFPWQRRCRDRGKKRHRPLQAVPPGEPHTFLPPMMPWGSPGVGGASHTSTHQVYLSQKACVALRHQMDCNVIDATD